MESINKQKCSECMFYDECIAKPLSEEVDIPCSVREGIFIMIREDIKQGKQREKEHTK